MAMTDPIITSALARNKPISAQRAKTILADLDRAQQALAAVAVVVSRAQLWAAHDPALAQAIREYREKVNE